MPILQQRQSTIEGLIGWWPFDGGAALDMSGRGHNGTKGTSGVVPSPGLVTDTGNCLSFAGTAEAENVATTFTGCRLDQPMTVSVWLKSSEASGNALVIGRSQNATASGWGFFNNGAGKLYVNLRADFGALLTSTADVFDGILHHVVLASDGATVAWYIDGLPSNSASLVNYTENALGLQMMSHLAGGAARAVTGLLDDVRCYSRRLSQNEIGTLYFEGRTSPATPARWPVVVSAPIPPIVVQDTGGSGNQAHGGSSRGSGHRNINDDPDAFSELLKEWRAKSVSRKLIVSPEPTTATTTQDDEVESVVSHQSHDTLDSDDLQEYLRRVEAAFDRSMVAYEAALAKVEQAKVAKAAKAQKAKQDAIRQAAIEQEELARQQAMQLAIEMELARLAYEDFLEEEDEIMLLS